MKNKPFLLLISISVFLLSSTILNGQTPFDHQKFIEEIKNSSTNIYKQCIEKYDDHLNKFPEDVLVHIEKCKFIANAQYDEYEEYNPNQEQFDSCLAKLKKRFPTNPDALLYQTECLWGDELKEVLEKAKEIIDENPQDWTNEKKGLLYSKIANQNYSDSEYQLANFNITKAITFDSKYETSLTYARILTKINKNDKALEVLTAEQDTSAEIWELNQKADLLLELKAYSKALDLYNKINEKDSSYIRNSELASTLVGVGEFAYARKYLVADTAKSWDKEGALRNLLLHDLKYHSSDTCITTYNKFRDIGYSVDPLGVYRIKLFLSHPLQGWSFRDIAGLTVFMLILLVLVVIPYFWILPVYFVGHHWKFITREKPYQPQWGLKMFWFVSFGLLFATFIPAVAVPEYLGFILNTNNYAELASEQRALIYIIFILTFAIFGLVALYKKDLRVLLSNNWSIQKSIGIGLGILLAFKLVSVIYVKIGMSGFGITLEDLASIPNIFLASKQDIEPIITNYGKLIGFSLICILVPIYEEIIFRGVVLDAILGYINFNSANIIQSALFASIHGNLFLFPVFFFFGLIAGIMRKKSGGLLPGIVFHIVNNMLAISVLMFK